MSTPARASIVALSATRIGIGALALFMPTGALVAVLAAAVRLGIWLQRNGLR